MDSRTVSDAPPLRPLSNDTGKVKNAVDRLAYQMNTTNMAQVFELVEKMILLGEYKRGMSAALTRTNGQPSFKFQTSEKVLWLRNEQVKMFLPPVTGLLVEQLGITKMEGKQPSVVT